MAAPQLRETIKGPATRKLEHVQTGPETGELAAQLRISISDVMLNPHPGRRGIDEAELDHKTCGSSTIDLRLILTKVDSD
jgi:hypothetical protein